MAEQTGKPILGCICSGVVVLEALMCRSDICKLSYAKYSSPTAMQIE